MKCGDNFYMIHKSKMKSKAGKNSDMSSVIAFVCVVI